ncbi:MAG: hypothetical protein ACLVJH_05730 [Faecalibacterium prausnitzii]
MRCDIQAYYAVLATIDLRQRRCGLCFRPDQSWPPSAISSIWWKA